MQKTHIGNLNDSNSTFKRSLTKADKKDCVPWLGMRIDQLCLEVYKTFKWEAGEQEDPAVVLKKKVDYVKN